MKSNSSSEQEKSSNSNVSVKDCVETMFDIYTS